MVLDTNRKVIDINGARTRVHPFEIFNIKKGVHNKTLLKAYRPKFQRKFNVLFIIHLRCSMAAAQKNPEIIFEGLQQIGMSQDILTS